MTQERRKYGYLSGVLPASRAMKRLGKAFSALFDGTLETGRIVDMAPEAMAAAPALGESSCAAPLTSADVASRVDIQPQAFRCNT